MKRALAARRAFSIFVTVISFVVANIRRFGLRVTLSELWSGWFTGSSCVQCWRCSEWWSNQRGRAGTRTCPFTMGTQGVEQILRPQSVRYFLILFNLHCRFVQISSKLFGKKMMFSSSQFEARFPSVQGSMSSVPQYAIFLLENARGRYTYQRRSQGNGCRSKFSLIQRGIPMWPSHSHPKNFYAGRDPCLDVVIVLIISLCVILFPLSICILVWMMTVTE